MDAPKKSVNILLVDDTPENLISLEAALSPLGEQLVLAHSGRDALRYLLHNDVAAILLDVKMPEMDGFETAELIRTRMRSRSTPILFVTAYKSDEHLFRGYDLGAVDFLFKPILPEVLRSKVSVFVELAHKADELTNRAVLMQEQAEVLKKAEQRLRQSENQLIEAQHLAHLGNWNWDLQSDALTWSDEVSRIFGVDAGPGFSPRAFLERVHPDDQHLVMRVLEESIRTKEPINGDFRIVQSDGSVRILHCRGTATTDGQGNASRLFGTVQDLTDRRMAEEQLRVLNQKLRALSANLQFAREEEGTRIAREIHDELGSSLTTLKWDLEALDKTFSATDGKFRFPAWPEKIRAMIKATDTTINSVRRIASELRPIMLDDLGLVEAIEWQAQNFQSRTGIACHCDCSLQCACLDRDQSTAVFRILQEALTNILRHALATKVEITMRQAANEFVLQISDDGRGITEEEKCAQLSLGLLGMQERAHLIGGRVDIAGTDGKGTQVSVRVPLLEFYS